jgi:hypothetical protein
VKDDDDDGVIINIANHSTCWRQHAFARCSFVSWDNVERVRTQEAITAKKSLWSPSSSLYPPSFYTQRDYYLIILNTCALLSIKYQVLPLESSSLIQERVNERRRSQIVLSLSLSSSHFLHVWNNETNVRLSCLNIHCRKGQQIKLSEWKI